MENLLRVYHNAWIQRVRIRLAESDVEKIAIYAEPDGLPTHAARPTQFLASGRANLGSVAMLNILPWNSSKGSMAR